MCTAAAEVATELTAHDQLKLAIMAGINRRLSLLHQRYDQRRGAWCRIAADLNWQEDHLSRLRNNQHEYFSVQRLAEMATQLGVSISVNAD